MPRLGMSRTALLIASALAVGAVVGATWAVTTGPDAAVTAIPDPGAAAVTAMPDLPAAKGDPDLPGLATARPAAGTVARLTGPFDDRFVLHDVTLGRTAVTGEVEVTSDVSDILELQVLAGFYDADGTLVGQGRYTHHLDEDTHSDTGPPEERERFRVAIPADLRDVVRSAAIGVPVLVNE